MKPIKQMLTLAAGALVALAACTNDPADTGQQTATATLRTTIENGSPSLRAGTNVIARNEATQSSTRAANDNPVKTAFTKGDAITLSNPLPGGVTATATFTLDGAGNWQTTGKDFIIDINATDAITADYTHNEDIEADEDPDGITTFADKLRASASLANGTIAPGGADGGYVVNLTFTHTRALLVFDVEPGTDVTLELTDEGGDAVTVQGKAGDTGTTDAGTARIILPPGTYTGLKAKLTPKGKTTPETIDGPDTFTFEAGTRYNPVIAGDAEGGYTLTIPTGEGGSGNPPDWSVQDPQGVTHTIASYDDLEAFRKEIKDMTGAETAGIYALQTANIIMPAPIGDEGNWKPIAPSDYDKGGDFQGTYNGNGYTIKDLHCKTAFYYNIGFIARLNKGTVVNTHFVDAKIEAVDERNYAGVLTGYTMNNATIALCSSTGTVSGNYSAGGLVGYVYGGHITRSQSFCDVTGTTHSGGLVGYVASTGTRIVACMAAGTVSDTYCAGGLVGENHGTIAACYATGTVSGTATYKGGLVGYNSNGTILNSYSTNADHILYQSYDNDDITANNNWDTTVTSPANPGEVVGGGSHTVTGIRTWENGVVTRTFNCASVWATPLADFPLIDYSYAGQ